MERTRLESSHKKLICFLISVHFLIKVILEFTQCSCAAHNHYLSQYFHYD